MEGALHFDILTMSLNNMLRDSQTKSCAPHFLGSISTLVYPVESLKNSGDILLIDSYTIVFQSEVDHSVDMLELNPHKAALWL